MTFLLTLRGIRMEKELTEVAGRETKDLILTLKQLEEDYKPSDKINIATNPETLRNMFMAIAKDIRVVIIKITEFFFLVFP